MFLFYALIGVGVILLMADRSGLLIASSDHVRWLKLVGLLAAAIVGIGPILWLATSDMTWWYFPIVIGYLAAFIAFAVGTLGRAGSRSITVQRVAYGVLLLLVAIPPTVLIVLAPVLAVAGLALVRVDEREADRVTEFKSAALRPDPPREVEE
jgi:Flp pilus assembly protein protease CpaA